MKEGGAQAVKLEGGVRVAPQIKLLHDAGIPVMAHIGFTPQSEHALGGYRVQGRGAGAEQLLADAHAVQEAGAFAVVLEMVPAEIAGQVTKELAIPTIGIGAGVDCDAQVLVWPDMAGLNGGRVPKFVKKYADLRGELLRAAREYADDVRPFPAATAVVAHGHRGEQGRRPALHRRLREPHREDLLDRSSPRTCDVPGNAGLGRDSEGIDELRQAYRRFRGPRAGHAGHPPAARREGRPGRHAGRRRAPTPARCRACPRRARRCAGAAPTLTA